MKLSLKLLSNWKEVYMQEIPPKDVYNRVQINESWFGKYDTLVIFYDRAFPTNPENHNTKSGISNLRNK